MSVLRRFLAVTDEDIERLRRQRLRRNADRVLPYLEPGEGLVGVTQGRLIAPPTPLDKSIPRLPALPQSAKDPGKGGGSLVSPRVAHAFAIADVVVSPLSAIGGAMAEAVGEAVFYVPGKIVDHLAVDRRVDWRHVDWSTMAARLVLMTLGVQRLDGYTGEFVVAVTDQRLLFFGSAYASDAPLYPLIEFLRGQIASVHVVPSDRSRRGKEEAPVVLVFGDGSSVTVAPDAIAGTQFPDLLNQAR